MAPTPCTPVKEGDILSNQRYIYELMWRHFVEAVEAVAGKVTYILFNKDEMLIPPPNANLVHKKTQI